MTATTEQSGRPVGRPVRQGQGTIGAQIRQTIVRGKLPFAVALYLMAIALPISFNLGPVIMSGPRLLLIVLIVPMTIRLFMGAYGKVLLPDVLFFLHVLWFTAALAINNPSQVISNAGSTGIEFIGGYVLGRAFIRDRESFVALIRSMGFLCLCLFPFAIYEALTGKSMILSILNGLPGIDSLRDVNLDKRMGLNRVQSSFSHPIHSGLFFILTFSLCFLGLKDVYSTTRRYLVGLACATCCFLALSSGALLALMLQLGLIVWAFVFRTVKVRWWLLLGLFALLYVLIALLSNRPPIRVFLAYATFSAHTAYWRTIIFDYGMQNIWANPWFGIGLNDWFRPVWMYSGSVDNFWLLTAMRYGIPGFLFMAIAYIWALWRIGTRDFDADPALWNLRRAWMFSFMGLTFTLCTVHIWHSIFSFVFFMFGSGMWFLYAKPAAPDETTDADPPIRSRGIQYTRFAQVRPRATATPARMR